MKTKNTNYRATIKRHNAIKNIVYALIYSISSLPRLILESIVKSNLGERTFSLFNSALSLIILAAIPLKVVGVLKYNLKRGLYFSTHNFDGSEFFLHYTTWYLFLIVYLYCFIKRYEEVKYNNQEQHTLDPGEIHPFFQNLIESGGIKSVRIVECFCEPGVFVVAGLVLMVMAQNLGFLLVTLGVTYSISMIAAYDWADNQIMDRNDKEKEAEELKEVYSEKKTKVTRDFNSRMREIESQAGRKKAGNNI